MKVVLAFDSYKGCLSAHEACQAAAQGIRTVHPDAEILSLPMSDGGEGLVDCIRHALNLPAVEVRVHGPLMEPRLAHYALSHDGQTAYMEMAEASGLTLVPQHRRNPMLTTTYGVGEMILDAVQHGCKQIVMGIGGSATCDGGQGMVEALRGRLSYEGDVCLVHDHPVDIVVASDVTNPLYGPNGAAYIFAPQKGATPQQVEELDVRLQRFARETEQRGLASPALALASGAGAAGGLGYGLMAHLKAELRSGIDLVLDLVGFDELLFQTDLIITGEGHSDKQTLMGKVPMGVLHRAQAKGIPVHLLSGVISDDDVLLQAGFACVRSINQGDARPLSVLMQKDVAASNLTKACKQKY